MWCLILFETDQIINEFRKQAQNISVSNIIINVPELKQLLRIAQGSKKFELSGNQTFLIGNCQK